MSRHDTRCATRSFLAVLIMVASGWLLVSATGASGDGASLFSGTVVDNSGNPVSSETVSLTDSLGDVFTTTTADDGSFSLTVGSASYELSLDGGGGSIDAGSVDLSSGNVNETLTLPPLTPFSVFVDDENGNPFPQGAWVSAIVTCTSTTPFDVQPGLVATSITPQIGVQGDPSEVFTDASGVATFDLFNCTGGSYSVSIPFPVGYNGSGIYFPVSLSGSLPATMPLVATFMPTHPHVSGTVVDAAGTPLAGATVELGSGVPSIVTNSQGQFSFYNTPAGTTPLLVSYNGSTIDVPVNFTRDTTGLVVTLPLIPVTVAVTDSNGNPVAGAEVTGIGGCPVGNVAPFQALPGVDAVILNSDQPLPGVTTDANGNAVFNDFILPCQSAVLSFQIVPSSGNLAETYVSASGPLLSATTFSAQLASLSGSLVDSSGQALTGQSVTIQNADGAALADTITNGSGSFALTVPPGTYSVAASGSIGDPTSYSVTIPGVNLTVAHQGTFELPTENVDITVTGPGGGPLENATVQIACANTSFPLLGGTASGSECATEQTGSTGQSEVELLPASSVDVTITPPPGSGLPPFATSFVPSNGLALTIQLTTQSAPVITSASSVSFTKGTASSFSVTTTGYPTPSLSESGTLPSGVKFVGGVLSGTPMVTGVFPVTITAANGVGTNATQSFTLTVR